MELNKLYRGDCLDIIKTLPENSIDSIITDPPYELGFMGKSWDNTGIANNKELWAECLRVLKPGGHLLAFSGTRTYHRMACAIEDAGFEVRDMIEWVYGSGFPKSLNIAKSMSKLTNIGICTCNVQETSYNGSYENSNNKGNNFTDVKNDRPCSCNQVQYQGINCEKMEEQTKNSYIQEDSSLRETNKLCELPEDNNKKEQGFEKVDKPILLQGLCESISEKEGYGNLEILTGMEECETTSQREGQGLPDMQYEARYRIGSPSPNPVQNVLKELNGESSMTLSELSQQNGEYNGEGNGESENDRKIREWKIDDRFICSKCRKLKSDIGGSSLKPAHEPICMARKPLAEKTVAENCLKWGTGGINIDESRIEASKDDPNHREIANKTTLGTTFGSNEEIKSVSTGKSQLGELGRFPANLIHDNSEEVRECFPETKSGKLKSDCYEKDRENDSMFAGGENFTHKGYEADSGNASRFFKSIIYQAKASKSERNKGCEELETKQSVGGGGGIGDYLNDVNSASGKFGSEKAPAKNNHPTVKPIALMEYLIKMMTREGQIVLDPFGGSGTTGVACKNTNRNYILIEKDEGYCEIIEKRLAHPTHFNS